jgi:hypothetical protein
LAQFGQMCVADHMASRSSPKQSENSIGGHISGAFKKVIGMITTNERINERLDTKNFSAWERSPKNHR